MSPPAVADELSTEVGTRSSARNRRSIIRTGDPVIDLDTRVVSVHDKPVRLSGKEYQIFELLNLRRGTTVTKEMLLGHLYRGIDEPDMKIMDVLTLPPGMPPLRS